MLEITDNTVEVTFDDGSKKEYKIYFFYDNPERGKRFYYLYEEKDPDSLLVMVTKDQITLDEPTEEEMEEAEEMLDTYESDPKILSERQ